MPSSNLTDVQMLRRILKQERNLSVRGALKRAIKNAQVLATFTPESLKKYGLSKRGMITPNVKAEVKQEYKVPKPKD